MLLSTACSRGEPDESSRTTQPSTPATTTSLGPSAAAEKEALTAYRGMWDAFVDAAKVSDPDAPDVRRYASDQALRLIVSSLYTNREQKKITKGSLALSPKVTQFKPEQAPTEAVVLDCVDSTQWLEYKVSGGLWDDVPGGKHRTTATVKLSGGSWKVSSFLLEESGTC
ncbi:hypothetical protein [Micromonospora zamorensis]|uniref:hypothetical protein n=1 Tax=Micromonospora zamorensis TaxID=709883 RepID=UPI0033B6F601